MNANYAFAKITFQYLGYKHNMKMMVKLHGLLCNVGFHEDVDMQILSAILLVLFQQVSTAVRREDADFIC